MLTQRQTLPQHLCLLPLEPEVSVHGVHSLILAPYSPIMTDARLSQNSFRAEPALAPPSQQPVIIRTVQSQRPSLITPPKLTKGKTGMIKESPPGKSFLLLMLVFQSIGRVPVGKSAGDTDARQTLSLFLSSASGPVGMVLSNSLSTEWPVSLLASSGSSFLGLTAKKAMSPTWHSYKMVSQVPKGQCIGLLGLL